MSLIRFFRDIGGAEAVVPLDTDIIWGEDYTGDYQLLPHAAIQTEIDYATAIDVDAFKHVPFIKKIGTDKVITYQQGLTDEDAEGQSIIMRFINSLGTLSSKYEVLPAFSNSGSAYPVTQINLEMIEIENKWYYISLVMKVNYTDIDTAEAIGIIACERLTETTFGSPFWVYSTSGTAPTPQTGFPQYNFNEPTSSKIKAKIKSTDYQVFGYPNDQANGFDGMPVDAVGDKFAELFSIKTGGEFVRISRNFNISNQASRMYFDFGDFVPVVSAIPSSPQRASIQVLNDGRIAIVCGSTSDRKELWFAVADLNTLNFRQENIYKVIYGQETGQVFPGLYKNGVWAYSNFYHDKTDNKIKIVCSKYKEGIFLFEFNYADLNVIT